MKIAIVGAGLSGLCTAIAFRKYVQPLCKTALELTVYDEPDPHKVHDRGWNDHFDIRLKNQGAAISLQSNALRVLRDLDAKLAERVVASGFPCKNFTWKTAGDYLLGKEYQDTLIISRPILVRCLRQSLPEDILAFRTVARVETSDGQRPTVVFEDGGAEVVDLVIGADGIRSPVRNSLFGDCEGYRPKYLGSCAVGGVLDNFALPQSYIDKPDVRFILGPEGTFGYCGLSQSELDKILYFSIYDCEPPHRGAKLDYQLITDMLRERHRAYTDPIIERCLVKATLDNIYPIFYMPDLPSWGRDGCVLVGDAAHAMSPSSGQGGSQAFEDAQTLALLAADHLQRGNVLSSGAIELVVRGFYQIRHKHVEAIKARLQEPKRPWSLATTGAVYAGIFVVMQVKYVMSFFRSIDADKVRSWDAHEEVRKYLIANS